MTRNTYGNKGKDTLRCPRCTWENLKPRVAPWETLVMMDCHECGAPIVLRRDRWLTRQPSDRAS